MMKQTRFWMILSVALFIVATIEAFFLIKGHREKEKYISQQPFEKREQEENEEDPLLKQAVQSFHQNGILPGVLDDEEVFSFPNIEWRDHPNHRDEKQMVLNIEGHEKGDFSVNIEGHQITITGKDSQSSDDAQNSLESSWTHSQSFPLPDDINTKEFRVERTNKEFIVVFKKK